MVTVTQTRPRLSLPTLAAGLLLVLSVARLLAELPLLWELEARDNAEAIVYGQAMRLLIGQPLYQPVTSPPHTVTAYMPLYYTLAAGLHAVLGPTFLAGRVLTLIGTVLLAAGTALLTWRVTGQRAPSMLAVGLLLTLGFAGPPGPPWLALYRVDVLGVALAVWSVATLAGGTSYRRILIAGALAALALLTKQTLAAATLAGGLWLLEQDRRKAVLFGGVAVGAPLVLGALMQSVNGAFFQNVVTANINPFDLVSLGLNLFILAIFQAGPLLAGLACVVVCGRGAKGSPMRLVVYYGLAALVPLAGLAKVGSWHNYWIEWAVPVAVLAAHSVEVHQIAAATRRQTVFVVTSIGLVAAMLVATYVTVWSVGVALDSASTQRERNAAFSEVVVCVRAAPGEAIAMPMDAVVLAGKPLYVEPAIFSILADAGVIAVEPVIETIRRGGVGVVVMDLRPEGDQWFHGAGQPIWRDDVLTALRDSMTLRSEKAGRLIYTSRTSRPPDACT